MKNKTLLKPVQTKLHSFPISVVSSITKQYNKAFHAKFFTLFASSESEVFTFSQRHKPHYDFCFSFMSNDEGQWYLDTKGIQRVRKWVIEQAKRNTKAVFKLHEIWEKDWKKYLGIAEKLKKTKFSALSDKEFYKKVEEFYSYYLRVGSVAYIADSFMSTGTEDWLESLISKELLKLGKTKPETVKLVRKLTSPVHLSFTLEAEYQLLKIAHKVIEKFSKLPSIAMLKKDAPSLYKELKKHEERFHWIKNNYYNVHKVSAEEFYEQISEIIKEAGRNKTTVYKILKEKEKELADIRKERQELIDKLALSRFIKNILQTARLFSRWKDIRKSGVYIGMYYFDIFLNETAKRTSYTKRQLTFTVFDEIKDILSGKDMHSEIAKREKQCFFAVTPKGYYIAAGKNADKYFKFSGKAKENNVTEIRGVVASPGYARGRVHIIMKTGEMANFKTGEILVTNQTTPEFVPIMKKAAAIITEQGGITSHAAIVSRELKKPCIIGTKTATSALLNGEIVEVDANNGIIRRER